MPQPTPRRRGGIAGGLLIAFLVVLALLVVSGGCAVSKYNGIVTRHEAVDAAWGKVESSYKRRADLVPQLVNTVKGAKDFESETLEAVVEARAKATSTNVEVDDLGDPARMEAFLGAQEQLGSALSRLLVVVESYPELRATEAFRDLQVQLEGTENRIDVARKDYVEAVRAYNTAIRRFPANLLAGLFGFERVEQFETDAADAEAPTVDFTEDE